MLRAVLAAAADAAASALILAGDVFDSNRIDDASVTQAAQALAGAPFPVIVLPGNHDPATPDSVYRRAALRSLGHLHIIGVTCDGVARLPEIDLEVWGTPHLDYGDMAPMAAVPARSLRWLVAVAHGHYHRGPEDGHRGWLIHDHQIAASGVDYVALGHWDVPQPAGDGAVPAYYSGSPEVARSINIVRLADGSIEVLRHPLAL